VVRTFGGLVNETKEERARKRKKIQKKAAKEKK